MNKHYIAAILHYNEPSFRPGLTEILPRIPRRTTKTLKVSAERLYLSGYTWELKWHEGVYNSNGDAQIGVDRVVQSTTGGCCLLAGGAVKMLSRLLLGGLCICYAASSGAYGPFDYTDPLHFREKLPVVERYHFNSNVENLIKGMTGSVRGDLEYVLRAFPNHHRALNSMGRLWRRYTVKRQVPPGAGLDIHKTAEYWYERAMRFAPQDGVVPLLYGIHLHSLGKYKQALGFYKKAEVIMPKSAEVSYNLGLLYIELKDYKLANLYAQKAYARGHPLPGLKNKLKRLGVWLK